MVADSYCEDGKYGSASVKQIAQTAIRFPRFAVSLVRDKTRREHPYLCLQSERFNTIGATFVGVFMTFFDCIPFENFLHASSLMSEINFMNGHLRYDGEAKLNKIHR